MNRCVIHIGAHKTGSTSIQHSLSGFADEQFVYAKLDSENHSLAMYSLFSRRPEKHHMHVANAADAKTVSAYVSGQRQELERAISVARGRTLIISGEDISSLPEGGLRRLRDFFTQRVDELKIVGYARSPGAFMASAFQQRVKSGMVTRFEIDRVYQSYRARFEKFDTVFGRDNVMLWKFDTTLFPSGCAVQDFCRRLSISLPRKRIVRLNESLPREAVSMFYTYRVLGPKHGYDIMRAQEGQELGDLLGTICKSRFRFSPDAVRPVLQKHGEDIQWAESRLEQSLAEPEGAHQPGDVRSESDLLEPDPEAVTKLIALLGKHAPKGIRGKTPDEVAHLVHALRMKCAADSANRGWWRKSGT